MAEKRNNGIYRANFTYTDPRTGARKRCRQSLGTRDGREARKREKYLMVQLETMPTHEETKKSAAFSGFAAHWLNTHVRTNLKPTTYRSYEQILRVHLVPYFGDVDLREISVESVELYKSRKSSTHSAKTVNNHLGILGKLLVDAVKWEYADRNPAHEVQPLRLHPQDGFDFWEPEESSAFLEAVKEKRPEWHPFFLCALRTGMRLGELCALRWQDVDLDKGQIHVKRSYSHGTVTTPKSGRSRTLDMSTALKAALKEHKPRDPGELVFPYRKGGYLNRARIKSTFWTCIRAAAVKRIRLHDMRHTFASQLVMKGVPMRGVQQLLGHSTLEMTMKYAHLSPSATKTYVEVLDA